MNVALPGMRAVAVSLILLCAGLLGQALGPLLVGFLSDYLQPEFGERSIRYAMLATVACTVAAAASFQCAMRYMAR